MTVPNLPLAGGTFRDVSPAYELTPYSPSWWMYSYVTGVPENALGWLTAQGWQIAGAATDDDGVTTYALSRQSMQSWMILQTLLNQYTNAYNEGRAHNSIRYNDVVDIWTNLLNVTRSTLNLHADVSDGHIALYVSQFDTLVAEVESEMALAKTAMTTAGDAIATQLAAYLTRLTSLESQYDGHATTIAGLLSTLSSDLTQYLADYATEVASFQAAFTTHDAAVEAIKTESTAALTAHDTEYEAQISLLDTEYDAHLAAIEALVANTNLYLVSHVSEITTLLDTILSDYNTLDSEVTTLLDTADTTYASHATDVNALLALLLTDYTSHATTATGYLTGLGTTDTARINEQFDNLLAKSIQDVTNRGLYSSALVTAVSARVERERSEALAKLNDQLNREKWENQHRIYEQKKDMRLRTIDGKGRLHGLQQEVLRYRAEMLIRLYGQLQDVRTRTLNGQELIFNLRKQVDQFQIDVENALYGHLTAVRAKTMEGKDRLYQLAETVRRWRHEDEHSLFKEFSAVTSQAIESVVRSYEAQKAITTGLIAQRDQLLNQFMDSRGRVLQGQDHFNATTLQNGQFLTDTRQKLALAVMQARMGRLQGRMDIRDREEKLMAYQLDTRNNLAVGLFGFVERREDSYPDMAEITKLVAGLGDAGGGWVVP